MEMKKVVVMMNSIGMILSFVVLEVFAGPIEEAGCPQEQIGQDDEYRYSGKERAFPGSCFLD